MKPLEQRLRTYECLPTDKISTKLKDYGIYRKHIEALIKNSISLKKLHDYRLLQITSNNPSDMKRIRAFVKTLID